MRRIETPISRPLLHCAVLWTIGMSIGLAVWEMWGLFLTAGTLDRQLLFGVFLLVCSVMIVWWEWCLAFLQTHIVSILACTLGALTMILYISSHQPFSIDQFPINKKPVSITAEVVTATKLTKSQEFMQATIKILDIVDPRGNQSLHVPSLYDGTNLYALLVYPKSGLRMQPKQRYHVEGVLEKTTQPASNQGIWYPITRLTEAQLVIYVRSTKSKDPHSGGVIHSIPSVGYPLQRLREAILSKLTTITSSNDAAFLAGVLFGVTDRLDPDVQNAYTLLGITHLLAVSGMNIELLIRPCLWVLRRGRVTYRYASVFTACIIVLYGLLTDGGASVNRAVIMGVTILLAGVFHRQPDPLSALSFSCIVCLWSDPTNLANIGFQFSFLASLFLLLFSPKLSHFLRIRNIPCSGALGVFIAATIATLPIQLYVFAQWSPYSIVTNLLLEPLMPICMITLLVSIAACYCFWPIAYLFGYLLHSLVWLFTTPVLWVYQKGLPILQFNQKEAVWSYGLYGVMAIWLVAIGRSGTNMHMNTISGNDSNTQLSETRCPG